MLDAAIYDQQKKRRHFTFVSPSPETAESQA